jgi:TetR/AcrR family transcriptional repressor of nem operon
MARYRDGQRARTRSQVIDAAIRTIRTDGTRAIGVAQVMASVGLTPGGFYIHFASKTELIDSAVEELLNACWRIFERWTRNLDLDDGLRSYINFYLSPGHRDARESGCPLPVLISDIQRLSETVQAKYAASVEQLTALIAASASGCVEGDPRKAATSVLAEMVGAVSVARSLPDAQAYEVLKACRSSIFQRLGLNRTGSGQSDAHPDQADKAATASGQRPAATMGAWHKEGEPQL